MPLAVAAGRGVRFGGPRGTTSSHFTGQLDDIRIYNRALSEEDVTALYELANTPATYTLEIAATSNGSVDGAGTYPAGTEATVTASPALGYLFTDWTGDGSGSDNPLALVMDGNQTVGATFAQDTRDPDEDGLDNYAELVLHGTDPDNSDSDGDGFNDGEEVANGANPNGAESFPITINPETAVADPLGSSNSFEVIAPEGISWRAESLVSWVSINGSSSGTGNGTISYSADRNSGTAPHDGRIQVSSPDSSHLRVDLYSFDGTPGARTFASATNDNTFGFDTNQAGALTGNNSRWGTTAADFSTGGSKYGSISDFEVGNFVGEDFTIEAWIYRLGENSSQTIASKYWEHPSDNLTAKIWRFNVTAENKLQFLGFNANQQEDVTLNGTADLSTGLWHHVAITRNDDTFSLFLDGVLNGTATSTEDLHDSTKWGLELGSYVSESNRIVNGNHYMSDFRVTKGGARYTSNFAVSAGPLSAGETSQELHHTVTQPAIDPVADTDGDGTPDIHETGTGTFVDASNTGSDPRVADSDGDGFNDGLEVAENSDPNSSGNFPTRLLTVLEQDNGSISGAETYPLGAVVNVEARPDLGYLFRAWTGNASGTDSPLSLVMDRDRTVGAVFTEDQRDPDDDGLSNYEEFVLHGTDPDFYDTDRDGINDGIEVLELGTDPLLADTDGDGFDDHYELRNRFDPTSPASTPEVITTVSPTGDFQFIEFRFNTAKDIRYRVESSTDLTNWATEEAGITGRGGPVYRYFSTENRPRAFFRAQRE